MYRSEEYVHVVHVRVDMLDFEWKLKVTRKQRIPIQSYRTCTTCAGNVSTGYYFNPSKIKRYLRNWRGSLASASRSRKRDHPAAPRETDPRCRRSLGFCWKARVSARSGETCLT